MLFLESPQTARSLADVAGAIYVGEPVAARIAAGLCELGLLAEREGRFVYAPRDEAIATIFARAAQAYRKDLIGMTRLIHDQTQRNATRFADAFRFRRDT